MYLNQAAEECAIGRMDLRRLSVGETEYKPIMQHHSFTANVSAESDMSSD